MSDLTRLTQNKVGENYGINGGSRFFPYSEISNDLLTGIEAGWPNKSWPLFSGTLNISNREILEHNGIATLIAWQGDQVWKLMGRILGGNFKPRYLDHKNALFGISLIGIDATNRNTALMGMIAGVVTLGRNVEYIDTIMYRFLDRVSQAKENIESRESYL